MISNLLPLLLVGVAPLGPVAYSDSVESAPVVTVEDCPMAGVIVYESPCYPCLSRNRRCLDCYPTFYQRNYRPPYHYRNLMDYPWHADMYPHMLYAPPCAHPIDDRQPSLNVPQPENISAGASARAQRDSSLRIVRSRSLRVAVPHQVRRRLVKSAEDGVSPRATASATDGRLR